LNGVEGMPDWVVQRSLIYHWISYDHINSVLRPNCLRLIATPHSIEPDCICLCSKIGARAKFVDEAYDDR
jgi:hypothetical protein